MIVIGAAKDRENSVKEVKRKGKENTNNIEHPENAERHRKGPSSKKENFVTAHILRSNSQIHQGYVFHSASP